MVKWGLSIVTKINRRAPLIELTHSLQRPSNRNSNSHRKDGTSRKSTERKAGHNQQAETQHPGYKIF